MNQATSPPFVITKEKLVQFSQGFTPTQSTQLARLAKTNSSIRTLEAIAIVAYRVKQVDGFIKYARQRNLSGAISLFAADSIKDLNRPVRRGKPATALAIEPEALLAYFEKELFVTTVRAGKALRVSRIGVYNAIRRLLENGQIKNHFGQVALYSLPEYACPFTTAKQYERYLELKRHFGQNSFSYRDVMLALGLSRCFSQVTLAALTKASVLKVVGRSETNGFLYQVQPLEPLIKC